MKLWRGRVCKVCSHDDPRLTFAYITPMSKRYVQSGANLGPF